MRKSSILLWPVYASPRGRRLSFRNTPKEWRVFFGPVSSPQTLLPSVRGATSFVASSLRACRVSRVPRFVHAASCARRRRFHTPKLNPLFLLFQSSPVFASRNALRPSGRFSVGDNHDDIRTKGMRLWNYDLEPHLQRRCGLPDNFLSLPLYVQSELEDIWSVQSLQPISRFLLCWLSVTAR